MMLGSSGDLAADRRYRYAHDLLKERDAPAAADLFRQALELAPHWAPAWFGLGEACEAAGDAAGAVEAFRRALTLDDADVMGAGPRLARLGAADAGMTPAYVAALFDEYAPRFDAHLTGALDYRGPEIVMEALGAVCADERRAFRFDLAMDLGCGTGLMGAAIAPYVSAIDGVDLSPAMVELARTRGAYRELLVDDAAEALSAAASLPFAGRVAAQPYDLILAADVLVYIGDLARLFDTVGQALTAGGLFAFTVQRHDGEGFSLGPDLRFGHSRPYIRAMAQAANLEIVHLADCVTRLDAGRPVPGHAAVLKKADG